MSIPKMTLFAAFFAQEERIIGFIRPNGSRKTTTTKIRVGILLPSLGNLTIGGLDIHSQN